MLPKKTVSSDKFKVDKELAKMFHPLKIQIFTFTHFLMTAIMYNFRKT